MRVIKKERDIILAQVPRGFIVQDTAEDGGKPQPCNTFAGAIITFNLWVKTKAEIEAIEETDPEAGKPVPEEVVEHATESP